MSRGIFSIGENNSLVELREQPYDSEALLQELLATHPSLLAGDQVNPSEPRRWLLISRELRLPSEAGGGGRWSVDHLLIDQDSVPTVVEVKRSSDTRIRREVVGQMLEYAANAVAFWPVETLRARFETTCTTNKTDPDEYLADFLAESATAEEFWQRVKTNLQAGRVRMVFVADEIPPELRRIVEFLNQQMDPAEVLAVEIKQYVADGIRTLVPSVIGQTEVAQQRKAVSSTGERWDEDRFCERLAETCPAEEVQIVRKILDWAQQNVTGIWWGKGVTTGSFFPSLEVNGRDRSFFAVWTSGKVEFFFHLKNLAPPFDTDSNRWEFLKRLNQIEGVSLPHSAVSKRSMIPLRLLSNDAALNQFLETVTWAFQQIRSNPQSPDERSSELPKAVEEATSAIQL